MPPRHPPSQPQKAPSGPCPAQGRDNAGQTGRPKAKTRLVHIFLHIISTIYPQVFFMPQRYFVAGIAGICDISCIVSGRMPGAMCTGPLGPARGNGAERPAAIRNGSGQAGPNSAQHSSGWRMPSLTVPGYWQPCGAVKGPVWSLRTFPEVRANWVRAIFGRSGSVKASGCGSGRKVMAAMRRPRLST